MRITNIQVNSQVEIITNFRNKKESRKKSIDKCFEELIQLIIKNLILLF